MPDLRALKRETALPCKVRGPVDFCAFCWLACICLIDDILTSKLRVAGERAGTG